MTSPKEIKNETESCESIQQLKERIKELTCLYRIVDIANNPSLTLQQILQEIVNVIPPAMQYAELASAQLLIDGEYYTSENFHSSHLVISVEINANFQSRGFIEVYYKPFSNQDVSLNFLHEEEILLRSIAQQISLIIERKNVEETNAKLYEQLRHADRLATIGQLSAGIAHEINEPLATILGFTELIQSSYKLHDDVKNDLNKILNATLHAREVVKKLMLFSRQMPPKKSFVNLNQLIEDGFYLLENRCIKEGVLIVKELEENLPDIIADPGQLHQVLVNLVVNAMQAMPEGGIIHLRTINHTDKVEMQVEDNGCGMDENLIKKIFIPFFTTKDINEGTGLGLSVVHGIINAHNGKIEVKSLPDKGTLFRIYLKVKNDAKRD